MQTRPRAKSGLGMFGWKETGEAGCIIYLCNSPHTNSLTGNSKPFFLLFAWPHFSLAPTQPSASPPSPQSSAKSGSRSERHEYEFTCHKRRPLPFPPKMRAGETESHRRLDDDLVNLPTCDNGLDLSKRFIEFDIPIDNAEERTIADPS